MSLMPNHPQRALDADPARAIESIRQALDGLAFGTVEITVHHGRIVQIERREKLRIAAAGLRAAVQDPT